MLRFNVLLGLLFLSAYADPVPARSLRGVSIQNSPYAYFQDGKIKGMVVDLMDKIGAKVGFNYTLYFSPDGMYGNDFGGKITGMIGEVYNNKADFAVADLTITEARKRLVDFTEPFMTLNLAGLIRRQDAANLHTLEDLVKKNELKTLDDEKISYGSITSGATIHKLSQTTDNIGQTIYSWLQANPKAMVNSMAQGLNKVNDGHYVLIVESAFAEYVAGQNCNLTILTDNRGLYQREYAIALPKESQFLEPFNQAIKELKSDGTIDQLKKTYWENKCDAKKSKADASSNEFDVNSTSNVDGFNI